METTIMDVKLGQDHNVKRIADFIADAACWGLLPLKAQASLFAEWLNGADSNEQLSDENHDFLRSISCILSLQLELFEKCLRKAIDDLHEKPEGKEA